MYLLSRPAATEGPKRTRPTHSMDARRRATSQGGHSDTTSRQYNPTVADEIEQRVLSALDELDIEYEALACDPDLADTAAFCAHYGYQLNESANAILIASKRPPGQYALCIALADTRLDVNRTVRDLMGVKKLSFASADATQEVTGMLIGGVTPFGIVDDIPVYVDGRIMHLPHIILGGGSRSLKLRLAPQELTKLGSIQIIEDLALPVS